MVRCRGWQLLGAVNRVTACGPADKIEGRTVWFLSTTRYSCWISIGPCRPRRAVSDHLHHVVASPDCAIDHDYRVIALKAK